MVLYPAKVGIFWRNGKFKQIYITVAVFVLSCDLLACLIVPFSIPIAIWLDF
ncbi:MAG: hypothetical protein RI894_1138 [Bacteroidota bacterium]|jgi:ABC-type enterochelin transport system permease subunit